MSLHHEDIMYEIYEEVHNSGLKDEFYTQLDRMKHQDKHRYKNMVEKWEYALYRIKGGPPKSM